MDCPLMRYHGGKWRIAEWVISHFPPHQVYVEPFGGAAGVLLKKPRVASEVYNDLDAEIVNVFRVLRGELQSSQLADACRLTPYARSEFDLSQCASDDPIEQARRTLFRAWASFGSAGATRGNSGMRTYTKPDGLHLNTAQAWARLADAIPAFKSRFRSVVIENRPAIDVMRQHDSTETLHYIDPPYLPETRSQGSSRYYRHKMSAKDHEALLRVAITLKGYVVLSGYDSPLYTDLLYNWMRVGLTTSGSSRYGSVKRTECLWLSPRAAEHQRQRDMFATA